MPSAFFTGRVSAVAMAGTAYLDSCSDVSASPFTRKLSTASACFALTLNFASVLS